MTAPPFSLRHRAWVTRALICVLLAIVASACRSRAGGEELPVLGTVQGFTLTDQDGRAFSEEALRGRVWAAAFMFTRCPTVCPRLTRAMRSVQTDGEKRGAGLHLVSFSVDPEHDTPEVLRGYAEEHGADLRRWSFVTGDLNVVRRAAVESFKMAVEGTANPRAEHYGITHGSHLVLVDRELRIRGFYRSSDADALRQLVDDALRLEGS